LVKQTLKSFKHFDLVDFFGKYEYHKSIGDYL